MPTVSLAVALCLFAQLDGPSDAKPGSLLPLADPDAVFQSACARLKALEKDHPALAGLGKVKPRIERTDDKRLKSAGIAFEVNAVPPGKAPARAKDKSKPFVYISVQVWTGGSAQPPAGLRGFQHMGKVYDGWVQVYASDPRLVTAVRRAVDEPLLAPAVKE
jgi:hypothetical protein